MALMRGPSDKPLGDASTSTDESLSPGKLPDERPEELTVESKYEMLKELGSGSFGFVQLARNKVTDDVVAIKFIQRGDHVTRYVQTEILNHRMLQHPHVIEFKEVFLTPSHVCIAMEYASGGDLTSYIKNAGRLAENVARYFFQQLIIGLDYCHRRGVVNRDIKLENTLLQMVPNLPLPLVKICDFGYSKAHFMSAPKSKVGSPAYMAPEVMKSAGGNYDGHLADIWSCGVMLYVMLVGQFPFSPAAAAAACNMGPGLRENRVQTLDRMLKMKWSWTLPSGMEISAECQHLLSQLLVPEPAQRMKMQEILADPWFTCSMPPDLLLINDMFLNHTDYTGVQAFDEVKSILQAARTPGPVPRLINPMQNAQFEIVEEGGRAVASSGGTGSWFSFPNILKIWSTQPPAQE